jgi:hypothetical protein
VVATSVRKSIMAWIDENPNDFVELYTKDEPISYHAEKIFDIVISTPDFNNRRETLWPLAMALVLLCPDTLTLAVHAILHDLRSRKEYGFARISKKIVLLDNVRQSARIEALCETAAICMTDFAKSVFLFPRDTQPELLRYVTANEKELNNLVFETTSKMYRNNRDRSRLSQLVFDRLVAVYRADPKEFGDVIVNKAYHPTANTYLTFNMARFCREHFRRTQAKLKPDDFSELYQVVAPRIRQQLQHILQTFVPTSPASPDRSSVSKGATPVDKADLIVEMLRNYVTNIDCALIGTKLDDKLNSSEDQMVYDETAVLDYIIEESVACKHMEIAEAGADLVEVLYAPENTWRWIEYAKANPYEGHLFWQYTYYH